MTTVAKRSPELPGSHLRAAGHRFDVRRSAVTFLYSGSEFTAGRWCIWTMPPLPRSHKWSSMRLAGTTNATTPTFIVAYIFFPSMPQKSTRRRGGVCKPS